ncbi:hypothetical protein BH23BAC3_BH23BAC3_16750 [soil metagenome]
MIQNHCYYILALLFIFGCNSDNFLTEEEEYPYSYDWENHVPFKTSYNTFNLSVTARYYLYPDTMGGVEMSEASGLGWSIKNPGKIWSHNDSGHTNTLFLLDSETGDIVARYKIGNTRNLDWEDMEVSYGPVEGESYIYIGDIGDNDQKRPEYSIYRFPEPVFDESHRGQNVNLEDLDVDRIRFQYPDGSKDTESLLVDPFTNDIFLVTKRGEVSVLYALPYPQPIDETYTIYKAGEFSFRQASAGTSTLDGTKVMIKNRVEIFYWERQPGEMMTEMLSHIPMNAPYAAEPQGEAIAFDLDHNYFTLSEALNSTTIPNLYKYNLKTDP